ncbi:MAG: hypothetical protein AAFO69_12130, partial [Bacteroidota bacterium]
LPKSEKVCRLVYQFHAKMEIVKITKMRYLKILLLFVVFLASCDSSEDYGYLQGKWTARWEMDQPNELKHMDASQFTMDGTWEFHDSKSVTISAFGRQDCILGEDTLIHTQQWYMSNDSILMKNDNGAIGLMCKVLEGNENAVKLQLLPDVHVFLSR